jgi:hypothetical protein
VLELFWEKVAEAARAAGWEGRVGVGEVKRPAGVTHYAVTHFLLLCGRVSVAAHSL